MLVTRYEPWSVLNQVQNEMSRLFASRFGADIQATGRNGVIEIVIPKHERVQPRKIAVQG